MAVSEHVRELIIQKKKKKGEEVSRASFRESLSEPGTSEIQFTDPRSKSWKE